MTEMNFMSADKIFEILYPNNYHWAHQISAYGDKIMQKCADELKDAPTDVQTLVKQFSTATNTQNLDTSAQNFVNLVFSIADIICTSPLNENYIMRRRKILYNLSLFNNINKQKIMNLLPECVIIPR